VESTFNWYWLVDGLQDNDFDVQLVNTAAVKQYDGLKFSGDHQESFPSRTPDGESQRKSGRRRKSQRKSQDTHEWH